MVSVAGAVVVSVVVGVEVVSVLVGAVVVSFEASNYKNLLPAVFAFVVAGAAIVSYY